MVTYNISENELTDKPSESLDINTIKNESGRIIETECKVI